MPLFAFGPGKPGGIVEAPDIARVCASAMGLDLARLNERLFVDAVVNALEPVIEEARHLVQVIEVGTGVGVIGHLMIPISDQTFAQRVDTFFMHAHGGIDITIHPATDAV